MNPDETLEQIRDAIREMSYHLEGTPEFNLHAHNLAEAVSSLAGWLTGSGPFPQDWTRMRERLKKL